MVLWNGAGRCTIPTIPPLQTFCNRNNRREDTEMINRFHLIRIAVSTGALLIPGITFGQIRGHGGCSNETLQGGLRLSGFRQHP